MFKEALNITRFLDLDDKGDGCRIVIIDTGTEKHLPLDGYENLTNESLTDKEEHGKYIHEIITRILPEANIYFIKVPHPVPDHILISALEIAYKYRPHAINLSISSEWPSDGNDPTSLYVDNLAKYNVVTCIAAGNGGPRFLSVGSPADSREGIAVGAVTLKKRVWRHSSRGPTLDMRYKPNVLAPTGYDDFTGTSFATPFVTCLAGLLNRELGNALLTRYIIELTATYVPVSILNMLGIRKMTAQRLRKIKQLLSITTDPRNVTGNGLIDAYRAYTAGLRLLKSLR